MAARCFIFPSDTAFSWECITKDLGCSVLPSSRPPDGDLFCGTISDGRDTVFVEMFLGPVTQASVSEDRRTLHMFLLGYRTSVLARLFGRKANQLEVRLAELIVQAGAREVFK